MGAAGGHNLGGYTPSELRTWIEESQDETRMAEQNAQVNGHLGDLLAQYNDRNVELTALRLGELEDTIESRLDTAIDLLFGGSVAKHTFVDGLSDVDALAVLKDPVVASSLPQGILEDFAEALRRNSPYDVRVHEGRLAVTVSYPDGMEIQILPAVRTATGFRIPDARRDEWSSIIRPRAFAHKLTEANIASSRRLVPVIKLAKAALANLPDSLRPSGYHVESLAIDVFEGYEGPSNYKAMLQYFFEQGSRVVLHPIRDSTGQSLHVDENLGQANSQLRQALSSAMDRIARRMSNADAAGSPDAWLATIGD